VDTVGVTQAAPASLRDDVPAIAGCALTADKQMQHDGSAVGRGSDWFGRIGSPGHSNRLMGASCFTRLPRAGATRPETSICEGRVTEPRRC
jgi:hypothetical protein